MSSLPATRVGGALRRAPIAVRGATRRRDARLVFVAAGLAYLLIYLWAIGDLAFRVVGSVGVNVVDRPFQRALETAPGAFSFEPITLVEFFLGTYLFSPINTGIGLFLAVLVGVNIALSYLAITQPRSCGVSAGTGVLAAIPAVLAGSACCAPALLLVLGVTATGTLLTVLPWLLPLGVVLLLGSLVYLAARIDPHALAESPVDSGY